VVTIVLIIYVWSTYAFISLSALRKADISLTIQYRLDGRTTGALNLGENQFQDIGQIKHTEKYDRASM
jgi:hypothetical protein